MPLLQSHFKESTHPQKILGGFCKIFEIWPNIDSACTRPGKNQLDFKLHKGCAREISAHESKLGFTGLQSLNPAAALRMAALKARGANEQRAQLRLPALEVNDRGGLSYCFQWVHLTGVQLEQRRKRKKEKCQVWTKIIMTENHSAFLSSISKETVILNRDTSYQKQNDSYIGGCSYKCQLQGHWSIKNTLRGCFHYTFAFVFLCQVSVAFALLCSSPDFY